MKMIIFRKIIKILYYILTFIIILFYIYISYLVSKNPLVDNNIFKVWYYSTQFWIILTSLFIIFNSFLIEKKKVFRILIFIIGLLILIFSNYIIGILGYILIGSV